MSVVNLTTGKQEREIPVGLEPTALYQSAGALFVANSNDDSISVINTTNNTVVQTVEYQPASGCPGGQLRQRDHDVRPRARARQHRPRQRDRRLQVRRPHERRHGGFTRGRHGGTRLHSRPAAPLEFQGLLPTDWYPVQVQPDPALGSGEIVVTNDRGIGDRGPQAKICKGPKPRLLRNA